MLERGRKRKLLFRCLRGRDREKAREREREREREAVSRASWHFAGVVAIVRVGSVHGPPGLYLPPAPVALSSSQLRSA